MQINFVSVADLIGHYRDPRSVIGAVIKTGRSRWEPGHIASAVETIGYLQCDQFGRFKPVAPGAKAANVLLGELEQYFNTAENERDNFPADLIHRCGWLSDNLPNFTALESDMGAAVTAWADDSDKPTSDNPQERLKRRIMAICAVEGGQSEGNIINGCRGHGKKDDVVEMVDRMVEAGLLRVEKRKPVRGRPSKRFLIVR